MTRTQVLFTILMGVLAATSAWSQQSPQPGSQHQPAIMYQRGAGPAAATTQPNMMYFGGTVLPNTTTYAIWWGNPSDFPSDQRDAMDDFLQDLDGSAYLGIAKQYLFGRRAHTRFGGNFYDGSAPPTDPDIFVVDAQVNSEVCKVAAQHGLKRGDGSIFNVFTSNFPNQTNYCAFHDTNTCADGTFVHYTFEPNLNGIVGVNGEGGCGFFQNLFCNNTTQGTHDVASVTAHELMETITDPYFDAWHDANFVEIGDPCEFQTKKCVNLSNDSKWQLQTIWSNRKSGCVQGAGDGSDD